MLHALLAQATERLLRAVPSFAKLSQYEIDQLMLTPEVVMVPPGQTVVQQGTPVDALYLCKSGTLCSADDLGNECARPGVAVGEHGLLLPHGEATWPTTLCAMGATPATLLRISRVALVEKLGCELWQAVRHAATRATIRSIQLLSVLDDEEVELLVRSLRESTVGEGAQIVREGELSTDFYIIVEGSVRITREQTAADAVKAAARGDAADASDGKVVLCERLGAGSYFGEMALLEKKPRAATVTATSARVTLLSLDEPSFAEVMGGPMQSIIARAAAARDRKAARAELARVKREELVSLGVLGKGQCSRVELVQHRVNGSVFALKVLNKLRLVATDQAQKVMTELEIVRGCDHPLLCTLVGAFESEKEVSMLLEVAMGGELFSLISKSQQGLSTEHARFYAASIACVFAYLHHKKVLYRDLKPENVVIDAKGYIKLVDFGFAKQLKTAASRTWTLCGTPQYLAPEIITSQGHGLPVDWWTLGVLTYEMMTGGVPFDADDAMKIYKAILKGRVAYPKRIRQAPKDFVGRLLALDPSKRLGASKRGSDDVASHAFLRGMPLQAIERREVSPPHVPTIAHPTDTSNFETPPDDDGGDDDDEPFSLEHGRARADFERLSAFFRDNGAAAESKVERKRRVSRELTEEIISASAATSPPIG